MGPRGKNKSIKGNMKADALWRIGLSRISLVATLSAFSIPYLDAADVVIDVSTVDDVSNGADGLISLREAISLANAASGDDVIINIPVGSYMLTDVGTGDDLNVSGDLDVSSAMNSLLIRGNGTTTTIVDGNNSDRVFHFSSNGNYTLERFSVKNGTVQGLNGNTPTGFSGTAGGAGLDTYGGGMYFDLGSTIVINNILVSNCHSLGGDGGNAADATSGAASSGGYGGSGGSAYGGGLYINNTISLNVSSLTIINCSAQGGDGGDG
ncbi:MAG: hypothetical protein HRU15_12575, partial [Planctomycetes bacterium]|nr:hypothetical protein [Planctomycetota bacterium]